MHRLRPCVPGSEPQRHESLAVLQQGVAPQRLAAAQQAFKLVEAVELVHSGFALFLRHSTLQPNQNGRKQLSNQ